MFIFTAYLAKSVSPAFISFYLIAAYLSVIPLKKYSRNPSSKSQNIPHPVVFPGRKDTSSLILLSVLLGIVYLYSLIPLFFSEFPSGGDPAFHLILIKKMLLENSLPVDWQPFAPVRINYPLGSHILVAGMSKISGVQPYQAFKACFPLMAVLTVGLMYLLGKAFFRDRKLGVAAAFSYSFLASCGALIYYRWGGLPNMMGMLFLLSSFWTLTEMANRYSLILAGFFMACLFMTHHHCMLMLFIIIFAFCMSGAQELVTHFKNRDYAEFTKRTFLAFLCALLFTSFYLPAYLLGVYKIRSQTAVFTVSEAVDDFISPLRVVSYLGPIFLFLLFYGIFLLRKRKYENKPLFWWIVSLLTVFIFFEYIYRLIAIGLYGRSVTAFTAGRFLVELAYPFSFIAGFGLLQIVARLKPQFLKTIFIIALVLFPLPFIRNQYRVTLDPREKEAFIWIKDNTPPNALIVNNSLWMPYVSWREGTYVYLPVTEPVFHPYIISRLILERSEPKRILAWAKRNKRPVYLYMSNVVPLPPEFLLVFSNELVRIFKVVITGKNSF